MTALWLITGRVAVLAILGDLIKTLPDWVLVIMVSYRCRLVAT